MVRSRSPFGLLFVVGFGVLIGAVLFGGAEAIGTVLAAPSVALGFILKIVLFFMLFGLLTRVFAGVGGSRRGRCWSRTSHHQWSETTRPRRRGRGSGGRITIKVKVEDESVVTEVIDSGPGIEPAQLGEVFDRFVKSDDSPGSGLGLSIARSLLRAHGGDLEIAASGPTGTTASMWIPRRP